MGMNIKDPEVHAMARELAERRSTSVTDAVRQALRAELERCPSPERPEAIEARKAAIRRRSALTPSAPAKPADATWCWWTPLVVCPPNCT